MAFPFFAPVLVRELPLGAIPVQLGQGPQLPVVLTVTDLGDTALSDLPIPPTATITLTLVGAGGGGSGVNTGDTLQGSGGGGGAGAVVVLTPDQWYPDALVSVLQPGDGGASAGHDGFPGGDCILTVPAGSVTCRGGAGGGADSHTGGAGGIVELEGAGFTVLASKPGSPGTAGTSGSAGSGGLAGYGGAGSGGAGSGASASPGADGAGARVLIQFAVG